MLNLDLIPINHQEIIVFIVDNLLDTNIQITNNTTGVDDSAGALIQQDGNDLYIWNKENSFIHWALMLQRNASIF